ncbi:hypothetical protein AURDEDRAFT_163537 [Auricularia subglabra TFB-10046 SS5]|nr:hypothetical protein AURDEDRAFT_163537 [Auricularia subglabra TFB-10046 SS5]
MPFPHDSAEDDVWIMDDESAPPGSPPVGTLSAAAGATGSSRILSALKQLRLLVSECDGRSRAPQWWKDVSAKMWVHLEELEFQIVEQSPSGHADGGTAGLSTALADLKAQNAQVITAIAQLAPPARPQPDSIVPPASGPQFRQPAYCITVSLTAVPGDAPLLSLPPADIKAALDAALRVSSIPALRGTATHSVRRNRDRLFVHATSDGHKTLLLRFSEEWLPALGRGAKLATRRVSIQVDLVSTRFEAGSPVALDALQLANPTTVTSRDQLKSVRWLHESRAGRSGRSSLALIVKDFDTARRIIYDGLCVLGEYCPANLLWQLVHRKAT